MSLNQQSGQVRRFVSARACKRFPIHQAAWQTSSRILAIASAFGGTLLLPHSLRADIFGNNGGLTLNTSGSWTDETTPVTSITGIPGSTDIARWDSNSAGGTFNLAAGTTWLGIQVVNPGATVIVGNTADNSSGGALTLGSFGIDMSAASKSLTIADSLSLAASQTWNIASGQTLTISTPMSLNTGTPATLSITGSGTTSFNNIADIISGTGGSIVKSGSGTTTLGALNAYTGSTTINNGTLTLNIASILTNNTSGGNFAIIPGGTTFYASGGTVSVLGGSSPSGTDVAYQTTISTLSAQAGATTFTQTRGGDSRVIDNFGNLTRSVGGTVNVWDNLTTNNTTDNANSGGYRVPNTAWNASNNTGFVVNGVVPWMTYTTSSSGTSNASGFAANNPVNVGWFVPAGTSNNGTQYSAFNSSTATTLGTSTQNVDVITSVAVPLGTTVNTLRWNNTAHSYTLTITPGDTLTIGAGGILITGAYQNHFGDITGGTLEGGNPGAGSGNDLMILDYDDPAYGSNSNFTIASAIADNTTNGNSNGLATALTKAGIGLLNLTNTANTYTGGTFLTGGIVNIAGEGSSFGSLGAVPSSPVVNNITFSGGTLQFASSFNLSSNRGIMLLDKGGTIDTNSFNTAYTGIITGTGSLTKLNAGTLTLSGASTYTGSTNVSAGTLAVLNTTGSATGTGNVTIAAAAYLTGNGTISGGVTLANGAGGRIDPGNAGVGTITLGSLTMNTGSIGDFEFASDSSYDQIVTTNLTLNGGGINLFQPGSTVLPYSSNGSHTYDLLTYTGSLTGSAANLNVLNPVAGFNYSLGSVAPVGATPGFVYLNTSGTAVATVSQWNTSTNGLNWSNTSNWTAGVPHMAGDIASFLTVSGQAAPISLVLDASQSVGQIIFNDSFSYTINASGGAVLTLDNGTGTAAINDQGGQHTINAPIVLNSNTTITTSSPTDQVILNGNISGAGNLSIGNSTVGTFGTVILTGSNTYADPTVIFPNNTLQLGNNTSTGSLGGSNLTDNGTFIVYRNTAYTISGTISGSGNLITVGSGVLTLSGTNSYSGSTNISGGTLQQGSASAVSAGNMTIGAGALFDMNGFNASVGSIAGAGTIDSVTAGGTVTLTAGSSNATTVFSGVIQNSTGTINFVKTGSGSLTLSGINTYSGNTTVGSGTTAAGTVVVTGAIGAGASHGSFSVGDAANVTVSGSGSITASSFSFGDLNSTTISASGGSINISTGALNADNDNTSGSYGNGVMSITGATVTANSVTIGRTNANEGATIITGGASTGEGIYVNGGTLNISTTLAIGTSNSSAIMREDAGSVTVGGTTDITLSATTGRFSILDLSGGTFTSNDTTGAGILIGGGAFSSPSAELLVRNTAVVSAPTVTLGTSNQAFGTQVLELIGGSLYVGAGGIVSGGGVPTVNLGSSSVTTAPILAASASWSSSLNVTLTSNNSFVDPIVQAANSSGGAENITLSGVLSGSGGLAKTGAGTLTIGGNNLYNGTTNVAGGTLAIATTGIIPSAIVSVASGATLNAGGSFNGGLEPGVVLNIAGTANFAASNSMSGTPTTVSISSFNLGSGGLVTVADPGVGNHANRILLSTGGLTLAGTSGAWLSKVDLTGNDLQVQNGNLADIYDQVKQGYNGGHWNGTTGITSSTAANDSTHLTALAVIQNSQDQTPGGPTLYGSFDNNGASDSDVLVKYTYYGDANEDGAVNSADYALIDAGYLSHGTLTGWYNGDFNYDGVINGSDYTLIDNAFNMQGASLASEIASPTAQIAGGSSSVPEPTSAMALVVLAGGLLGRRRFRR